MYKYVVMNIRMFVCMCIIDAKKGKTQCLVTRLTYL